MQMVAARLDLYVGFTSPMKISPDNMQVQELLAPDEVVFYSREWTYLRSKLSLRAVIFESCGIERDYLSGTAAVQSASVGKRMSWASRRQTTREEDLAYSLLGLFDVNMPMLYGEGGRQAFLRLQHEI